MALASLLFGLQLGGPGIGGAPLRPRGRVERSRLARASCILADVAFDLDRLIDAGERFVDARQLLQHQCAAEIGFGEFRLKRDRAVVAGERFLVAAGVEQGMSAIAMSHAEIRIERDGLVVACNGLLDRARPHAGWRRG